VGLSARMDSNEGETSAIEELLMQILQQASEDRKPNPGEGLEEANLRLEAQLKEIENRVEVQERSISIVTSVVQSMSRSIGVRFMVSSGLSEEATQGEVEYQSLARDGELPSIGGEAHPEGCRPCFFFCFSRTGCHNGRNCVYCHGWHLSKKTKRLMKASSLQTSAVATNTASGSTAAASSLPISRGATAYGSATLATSSAASTGATAPASGSTSSDLPSLEKNGPQPSRGGVQHPHGCRPCLFYCFSKPGCRNAYDCSFCHQVHVSKRAARQQAQASRGALEVSSQAPQRRSSGAAVSAAGGPPPPPPSAYSRRPTARGAT